MNGLSLRTPTIFGCNGGIVYSSGPLNALDPAAARAGNRVWERSRPGYAGARPRHSGGRLRFESKGVEHGETGQGQTFHLQYIGSRTFTVRRYDAVFLLDVLEHVDDDLAFLRAALRHLRSGGLVVVNVPASMRLFSDYDRAAGHLRRYTTTTLTTLLRRGGAEGEPSSDGGCRWFRCCSHGSSCCAEQRPPTPFATGFVPPNEISQLLLQGMKNIETALPFSMPFGTSILAWSRLRV